MIMVTFLVVGIVASVYVILMGDWHGNKGRREQQRHKIINHKLRKIREEQDAKDALDDKWKTLKA